jgi:hypothetical protein
MQFCDRVYFGEKAKRNGPEIMEKLKRGSLQPEVYVITPPLAGNNLLEIYPSAELLLPPFCAQERLIVGVAVTYWEALEVVRQIVDDLQKQGEL